MAATCKIHSHKFSEEGDEEKWEVFSAHDALLGVFDFTIHPLSIKISYFHSKSAADAHVSHTGFLLSLFPSHLFPAS